MQAINIYLLVINTISFIFMGIDKLQAIRKNIRIREVFLLTLCIFGGSAGTVLGMIIFRHKIRKIKFLILLPLFMILNILLYKYIIN